MWRDCLKSNGFLVCLDVNSLAKRRRDALAYAAKGRELRAHATAAGIPGWIRCGCLVALDQLTELIEERRRVVRTWGCFGMVLDTVDRLGFVAHAFHCLIVQIDAVD